MRTNPISSISPPKHSSNSPNSKFSSSNPFFFLYLKPQSYIFASFFFFFLFPISWSPLEKKKVSFFFFFSFYIKKRREHPKLQIKATVFKCWKWKPLMIQLLVFPSLLPYLLYCFWVFILIAKDLSFCCFISADS